MVMVLMTMMRTIVMKVMMMVTSVCGLQIGQRGVSCLSNLFLELTAIHFVKKCQVTIRRLSNLVFSQLFKMH